MEQTSNISASAEMFTGLCAALERLAGTEFVRLSEADVLEFARTFETVARLVFAVQVQVTGELDIRRSHATFGCVSTTALLRQTLTISGSDARNRVNTARAVVPQEAMSGGETPPALPDLAAAVTHGAIGVEQTRTIVATMRKIPAKVDEATRTSCAEILVQQGQPRNPSPSSPEWLPRPATRTAISTSMSPPRRLISAWACGTRRPE